MTLIGLLFLLIVLIFSVMIHEVSHGYTAEWLGDPTARLAGRLTLNPIKHIDLFGSILLPGIMLLLAATTGFPVVFGWAKPVPYNPMNLKKPKSGAGKIAIAGPLSNFAIALVFGLIIRGIGLMGASPETVQLLFPFEIIVWINVLLGVFNLVPIPPLDGSKVLYWLLPDTQTTARIMGTLQQYGIFILLLFIFFGFELIIPIIQALFSLFVGYPFGL